MQAHWSREDLPHWDKIRDADDMAGNGLRSRVIDIALDEVVDHLNANHPKSDDVRRVEAQRDTQKTKARRARRARDEWQRKCEIADDNASMWFGEAVEQRERADRAESLAGAAKATAHTHLETLVSTVAKRDAAVKRAEAAEAKVRELEQDCENWRITAINRANPSPVADPVEDKARELAAIAYPGWPWGALAKMSQQDPLRRLAVHILGDAA